MKNKRGGIAGDILLYILATIMFVFVGYIVAGAYGGWEGAPENFMDRIMFILDNIDVNVSADGEYCAYGHDNVTFDVYINGSRVADDKPDFSGDPVKEQ